MKLVKIDRPSPDRVFFELEDGTILDYSVVKSNTNSSVFLDCNNGGNDKIFTLLGLGDPNDLYKSLGIFVSRGWCPYCKREDLSILFDYLLKHHSTQPIDVEYEEVKLEEKDQGEWDWLL